MRVLISFIFPEFAFRASSTHGGNSNERAKIQTIIVIISLPSIWVEKKDSALSRISVGV